MAETNPSIMRTLAAMVKSLSGFRWSSPLSWKAELKRRGWTIDRQHVTQFKGFINDPFIKKSISIGSEIASAFAPFSEKPTTWNIVKAVFLSGKAFVDNFEVWAHDYFDDEGIWVEPFPRDFTGAIVKVLRKYPYETMKTSTEGSVIYLVSLPEGRVGWVQSTKVFGGNRIDRIYAETASLTPIRERIKQLLWDQFKGKPLVLRRNNLVSRTMDEDRIVLEIDDAFHPLPSGLASTYTDYLGKALRGGVNRSVMLYGPPGTGKSTLARTLVDSLSLRSFRIRIEDVGGVDSPTLFEAIDIFKPDAIILDDFDRANSQEQLLETLEHFQRHIKLVVATVNRRDNLDEALLRPGRFDELILVKQMDDNVIKNVLGEANLDVFDKVKEWPIAFIQEYVKRRRFMSKKDAMKSIQELADRVDRLGEYDDDGGLERVYKKMTAAKDAKNDQKQSAKKGGFKRPRGPARLDGPGDPLPWLESDDDEED